MKWGFLGAGWIANRAMGPSVHAANNAQLFGVASRDAARSKKLEPQTVYNSYQQLLDDPQIEVVYISLANHQHLEWVTKSLEAGKHVLCEKPLGLNALEVQKMIECSQRCDRLLVGVFGLFGLVGKRPRLPFKSAVRTTLFLFFK